MKRDRISESYCFFLLLSKIARYTCYIFFILNVYRMGIPTPKKETANKTWSEEDLNR